MTMTNYWFKSAFYSLHSSVNNIRIQIFDQNKRPVKVPLGNARPDNKKFTSKSLQVTKHWPIRHKFQNNAIYNGTFRHLGYPISQELTDSNTQGTRDVAVDKSVNILDRWPLTHTNIDQNGDQETSFDLPRPMMGIRTRRYNSDYNGRYVLLRLVKPLAEL